jgi:hypothetical protein
MARLARFAPLTGVLFVVLAVAGAFTTGNTPDNDATLSKVTQFYSAHHDRVFAAGILWAYAAIFLAFFGAALWSRVRGAGLRPILAAGTIVGTAVASVGLTVFGGVYFTLGDLGNKTAVTGQAIQALHALTDGIFLPIVVGVEVLLWAVGLAAIRGGILPRWLGWIALVIAILQVTPIGFFALVAFLIWTLIVSIWSTVRPGTAPAPTAAT